MKNDYKKRNFFISVIHIMPECASSLRKGLSQEYYMMNNSCDVKDNVVYLKDNNGLKDFYGSGINIQAIVGVNGSGKSSLLEIIYRVVNNLSSLLNRGKNRRASETLYYIDGLFAEIYYVIDGELVRITCKGDIVELQKGENERVRLTVFENNGPSAQKVLMRDFIKWAEEYLFYTIVTNYSMQAFNANDYVGERCFMLSDNRSRQYAEEHVWINSLFHKNDGYMTPIVLNPYRDNGVVNMNKEHGLTIYRLSAAMIYAEKHHREFMKDYRLHRISYQFNKDVLDEKYLKDYKVPSDIYKNYRVGKPDFGTAILCAYDVNGLKLEDTVQHTAAMYLIYKTFSIANNYPAYDEFVGIGYLDNFCRETNSNTACLVDKLVRKIKNDRSHITLKIRQVIHFIKVVLNNRLDTDWLLTNMFTYKDYVACVAPEQDMKKMKIIQEYLPPSFFRINITLDHYENGKKINVEPIYINRMSSGERQYLYTFSTYIYHLLNLLGIQDKNRVRYRRFNLILDEVEICFHPEYQRRFIDELIRYIKRMYMNTHATFNIIIATHSPFILSDIPQSNILYLEEGRVPDTSLFKTPFAANICDILYQSFFLKEGFVGEFARNKVNEILLNLTTNKKMTKNRIQQYNQIYNMVGDPFLKMQLKQLLDRKNSHEKSFD